MTKTKRPEVMATRHMVVAGHPLAAQAGFQILEAGGNAIDAGIAVGLAINVLESEMTCFGGVAPSMIRMGDTGSVQNFVGVGRWPRALDAAYFHKHHSRLVPERILNTVVPAAPDIWLTALQRFGTMSFTEVASAAIRLARDGFPMYPFMVEVLGEHLDEFKDLPGTANIFYPRSAMPPMGERFVQTDLGKTLQYLCDEEEAAASGGRDAGIDAGRRAFYEGDIAAAIVRQQDDEGGLMTREDLSEFRAEIEDPVRATFGAYELYSCGPWCQGPMILGAAQMLSGMDLVSMGHHSADYIHAVVGALKLSAADREAYFGDPALIDVPLDRLLDIEYSRARRARIDPARAFPGMPPAGQLDGYEIPAWQADPSAGPGQAAANPLETSYFCVIDGEGNLFSATPSDPTTSGAVVPGLGITTSRWGSRAHTGMDHPARVGPGWRPRMSANPILVVKPGEMVLPSGSPGSEVLGQSQLQVMLNILVFGMTPQAAVETPRFASFSWPASALPHAYNPARMKVERGVGEDVGEALSARGHEVQWWPDQELRAGSVCTIRADQSNGILHGGADPRRMAYAVGW